MNKTFLDIARTRYTTKQYNQTQKVAEAQINELKEILRLAPSSINSQPWKFIFVSDQQLKNSLAQVSRHNATKINDASHFIVFTVIDDLDLLEKHLQKNIAEYALNYFYNYIKPLPEADVKAWLQHQVYLSLGFFLSACAAMQIDSTPMEGIETQQYDRILKLEKFKTLFAVTVGYRHEADTNQPSVKPKTRMPLNEAILEI
mgnify:CR=1 FL=1